MVNSLALARKMGHEPEHLVVLERKCLKTDGSLSHDIGANVKDLQLTESEQNNFIPIKQNKYP